MVKANRTTCERCAHCGKPLPPGALLVHKKCAKFHLVTDHGVFRQLSFLDASGQVSRTLRWTPPPIDARPEMPESDGLPPVRPFETYTHTPGKCAYCGRRVRNKSRLMHRRCLNRVIDPPPPPRPKPLTVKYPPSRYCSECKSLDNSLFPSSKCRCCGALTVEKEPPGFANLPGSLSGKAPNLTARRRR